MDSRGRPVYREWTPWAGWILIVFWGTMVLAVGTVALAPGEPAQGRITGALLLALLAAAVQWIFVGLSVRLYRDDLVVGLGTAGLISKRVAYDDILSTKSVKYSALVDFGGWGVRRRGKKRAWTARGNEAVVLDLVDGIQMYVGSEHPQRLEERIAAVGGTRIGSKTLGDT
jgi:hypothetical protein